VGSCNANEAALSKAMVCSSTVIKDTLATDHQQKLHEEETLCRGFLSSSGTSEEHGRVSSPVKAAFSIREIHFLSVEVTSDRTTMTLLQPRKRKK